METELLRTANTAKGMAVFARGPIARGVRMGEFEGFPVPENTQHSLTLAGQVIEPTGILKNLNHSCAPNAFFIGRVLLALRPISAGEEITIDYMETETGISHPFSCSCGSATCRGKLG